jgi:hypothetical protein
MEMLLGAIIITTIITEEGVERQRMEMTWAWEEYHIHSNVVQKCINATMGSLSHVRRN